MVVKKIYSILIFTYILVITKVGIFAAEITKKATSEKAGSIGRILMIAVPAALLAGIAVAVLLILRRKHIGSKRTVESIPYTGVMPVKTYSIGNAQHVGKREEQQDSFGISDINDEEIVRQKGILAIVADGMGGLDNGKDASRAVVFTMLSIFDANGLSNGTPEEFERMILEANNAVNRLSQESGQKLRIGSTVVAVLIRENRLYWISVGDSRIYLYRNGRIAQLTKDHNYGNKLDEDSANGLISVEEAMNNQDRQALTSFIGMPSVAEIDQNFRPLTLNPGDRIILCSDGVYGSVTQEEMEESLKKHPQEAAEELVNLALLKNKTYQDNMTVVVLGYL